MSEHGDDEGTRTIAVLTTGRQDWGSLRSVCTALRDTPMIRLDLMVGGMHLSPRYGRTVEVIEADGFRPDVELSWLPGLEDPPGDAQAAAAAAAVGAHLRAVRPHGLLVMGDRMETAAAALAATIDRVPIAHLHGGEQTFGAFDDVLRHAITKLSHLHLVSSDEHARRVIAMGEDPGSVHVVGPPGVDQAFRTDLPDRAELATSIGIPLRPPIVVVTVHPATLAVNPAESVGPVIAAMDAVDATYVISGPNADPGSADIRRALEMAAAGPRRVLVEALGDRSFWGLLKIADAMLGNSSSGIVEAPALRLPVVNVGDRQAGRARQPNVIDATADDAAVTNALRLALDGDFRRGLPAPDARLLDGHAGERAAHIIAAWRPSHPPRKAPMLVPA